MTTNKIPITKFRNNLLNWFDKKGRNLPWRYKGGAHPNPYHVWLSEIMLQQTTVEAVKSYFVKFISIWPTLEDLADATQNQITDEWAGLGYYSRARNLHKCAQMLVNEYDGSFPKDEKALLLLPGIGPYTASAIQSIAFNKPSNVVDGNIERIMARVFNMTTPFPKGKGMVKDYASNFIGEYEGGHSDYVQALMDLGSNICKPKSPLCHECPLSMYCEAFKKGVASERPLREAKKAVPHKKGHVYIFLTSDGQLLCERRKEKGMLAGMNGLPTSGWKLKKQKESLLKNVQNIESIEKLPVVNHVFTHFKLSLTPHAVKLSEKQDCNNRKTEKHFEGTFYWQDWNAIKIKTFPTLFGKVIRLAKKTI